MQRPFRHPSFSSRRSSLFLTCEYNRDGQTAGLRRRVAAIMRGRKLTGGIQRTWHPPAPRCCRRCGRPSGSRPSTPPRGGRGAVGQCDQRGVVGTAAVGRYGHLKRVRRSSRQLEAALACACALQPLAPPAVAAAAYLETTAAANWQGDVEAKQVQRATGDVRADGFGRAGAVVLRQDADG
jgi:hypothetical protein